MINEQNDKVVVLFGPGTTATNAVASNYFDRKNYNYATVEVAVPPATATNSSAKLIALALTEGDTTSSFAAFGAFTGTTNSTAAATEFVLPVHNNTSVGAIHKFYINLRDRKRYIKVAATPGASHTTIFGKATLSRAETAPDSNTERGVSVSVIG
jgi:hypothetical protein